jgi:hypothetical protein
MRTPDTPPRLADINREAYLYAGAGATVAWQLALPGVGRGVARHSTTLDRPLQRLQATMAYVYAVSLGNEADRAAIAAHVNRAHRPVRGEGIRPLTGTCSCGWPPPSTTARWMSTNCLSARCP